MPRVCSLHEQHTQTKGTGTRDHKNPGSEVILQSPYVWKHMEALIAKRRDATLLASLSTCLVNYVHDSVRNRCRKCHLRKPKLVLAAMKS